MPLKIRIQKVKDALVKHHLDAILVSSVPNIIYLTGYSGFSKDEREAFLLITKTNNYLITDGRYSEAVEPVLKDYELLERSPKVTYQKIFTALAKRHRIKRLGIEDNDITVSEHKILSSCFNDLNHFTIGSLRIIKESKEIESIEKACRLGDKIFDFILNKLVNGVTEKHVAFEIEFFIKNHGADPSFPPIVAFGKNSSKPHHQTNNIKLKKGDFVLLDFGAKVHDYCSDMTRTVFFGKASSKQKRMYQTVLDTQQKSIEYLQERCHSEAKPKNLKRSFANAQDDIQAKDVDRVARDYIISKGYPTIPHSLGHGIGLEVHEVPSLSPNSKDVLKTGMVFSVEPGIYIPKFGGVRIEDLVVLENNGPRVLTKSPKKLMEL